jgi:hypothetical protein
MIYNTPQIDRKKNPAREFNDYFPINLFPGVHTIVVVVLGLPGFPFISGFIMFHPLHLPWLVFHFSPDLPG